MDLISNFYLYNNFKLAVTLRRVISPQIHREQLITRLSHADTCKSILYELNALLQVLGIRFSVLDCTGSYACVLQNIPVC